MEGNENKFKKYAPKIVIPILIVIAIGAIFVLKARQQQDINGKGGSVTDNIGGNTEEPDNNSSDFALHVEDVLDLDKLKSYGLPIMIDFGADYCPPCREMKPTIEKLNKELKEKAIIKYVDVEKLPKVTQDYPIRVIPTQVFYDKDGKPFKPADPNALGMYMYSDRETNEHLFTVHEGLMTEEKILLVLREMGMEE